MCRDKIKNFSVDKLCRVYIAHTKKIRAQLRYVFISSPTTFARQLSQKKKKKMGTSAKDPPLKLTSMLIGISLIKILVFYKIFFLNELRVKFLSSLKQKSVKNSE